MNTPDLVKALQRIVGWNQGQCENTGVEVPGEGTCGACPMCVASVLITRLKAEPEPEVLVEGWARENSTQWQDAYGNPFFRVYTGDLPPVFPPGHQDEYTDQPITIRRREVRP